MKNKEGLEAAFALLLLKFVPTQYLPAASFLQNMIRDLSVVLGKGLAEGNITRDSLITLICSDSSIALKLGCTSVVCRNALLQELDFEEPLPRTGAPGPAFWYKIAQQKVLQFCCKVSLKLVTLPLGRGSE